MPATQACQPSRRSGRRRSAPPSCTARRSDRARRGCTAPSLQAVGRAERSGRCSRRAGSSRRSPPRCGGVADVLRAGVAVVAQDDRGRLRRGRGSTPRRVGLAVVRDAAAVAGGREIWRRRWHVGGLDGVGDERLSTVSTLGSQGRSCRRCRARSFDSWTTPSGVVRRERCRRRARRSSVVVERLPQRRAVVDGLALGHAADGAAVVPSARNTPSRWRAGLEAAGGVLVGARPARAGGRRSRGQEDGQWRHRRTRVDVVVRVASYGPALSHESRDDRKWVLASESEQAGPWTG